jgi:hypothetical protein
MPDRADASQEGVTLPPRTTTRLIAEAAARQVVLEHIKLCPFAGLDIEKRLRCVELNLGKLIGFMAGSGLLGGTLGAAIVKAFSP